MDLEKNEEFTVTLTLAQMEELREAGVHFLDAVSQAFWDMPSPERQRLCGMAMILKQKLEEAF